MMMSDKSAGMLQNVSNGVRKVLDVREERLVRRQALIGSRHIVRQELLQRRYELPPTSVKLAIVGAQGEPSVDALAGFGWDVVLLEDCPALWQAAESLGLVCHDLLDQKPVALFEPCDFLGESIDEIERDLGRPGTSLDVGCGSGRDVIFLARRGWHVTGVDFMDSALERALAFATSYQVQDAVELHNCRIMGDGTLKGDERFASKTYDLVICVRFLQIAYLHQLPKLIKPGGFICYATFIASEHDRTPRNQGRLLPPGILQSVFQKEGFVIIKDTTHLLPDGRPLGCFLARRNASTVAT